MPEARKLPVQEISYDKMMKILDLDHEQFIDLCILMGCDYVPSIKGRHGQLIEKFMPFLKVSDQKNHLN